MVHKLLVGAFPRGIVYKYHGKLLFNDDQYPDTIENRLLLENLGVSFLADASIKDAAIAHKQSRRSLALDCTKCGVCCAQRDDRNGMVINGILPNEIHDLESASPGCLFNDPRYGATIHKQDSNFPGIVACPFFCGEPGVCCGCSIYDSRPAVCRYFLPGNDDCLLIRNSFWKGLANDPRSKQELVELNKILGNNIDTMEEPK